MASGKKQPIVQFKGIMKRFGSVVAVEKMNFEIEEGSLVTLLGPSGCGKTTLLRMVAGLEEPTEGDIFIKGVRINDTPIHKRNLGMIFQNYALFPHKTIFDNVAFGLKYRDVPKDQVKDKVTRALEMVRLPGVENRMPSQLSGGQQQRIAMARAIVIEPDVLLMDEPLSALDENLREEMRREVDNLQQMIGVTTIFVTHDQREALSMSDKILVMQNGRKQQEGPPEVVYNEPKNHFVADFLGHSNFIKGEVVAVDAKHVLGKQKEVDRLLQPFTLGLERRDFIGGKLSKVRIGKRLSVPSEVGHDLIIPTICFDYVLQLGSLFGQRGIPLGIGYDVGLAQQLFDLTISSRQRLELVRGKHI